MRYEMPLKVARWLRGRGRRAVRGLTLMAAAGVVGTLRPMVEELRGMILVGVNCWELGNESGDDGIYCVC